MPELQQKEDAFMKRLISMVLVVVLCLSLCACGKSEATTAYENLVAEIGTVSLASEDAIAAAESAYRALSAEDKESVAESNDILVTKRAEFDALEAAAQAKAEQEARLNSVVALIESIGDVTLDSEVAIIAAEEAYENLSAEEQTMISEAAGKLAEFRAAYESAVAEQMAAHAAEVTAAIEAIGTVTVDSKDAIELARELYNALTDEEKTLVAVYNILEAAEADYEVVLEAEKQRIISEYSKKFETEVDPIEGITWYMHNDMPDYIDTRSYIIPYIGVRGNNVWICIRYNYTGDSWIFWEKLTIMADGVKYYKYVGYYDTIRDNDSDVWEWWDEALTFNQSLDSDELKMLRAIADSSETIIRFEGDEYYYDLYVKDIDKQMIQDTLALYEAMLG